jgi:hypothetical protein
MVKSEEIRGIMGSEIIEDFKIVNKVEVKSTQLKWKKVETI